MIWIILGAAALLAIVSLAVALGLMISATRRANASDKKTLAAKTKLNNLQKEMVRIKKQSQQFLDLELATTQQIVDEMRSRPNNRFLMLIPRQQAESEGMLVETHICNIDPNSVLMLLRVAHDGVIQSMQEPPDDEEWTA